HHQRATSGTRNGDQPRRTWPIPITYARVAGPSSDKRRPRGTSLAALRSATVGAEEVSEGMSAKRTERLLNLTICLLATRRFLTKDQIREAVPDYARCATDEAFERMFERDKDELRDLGIALATGAQDP